MILSVPDIRRAVESGKIQFNPPIEENQWGEASVDLRLGFTFTQLVELPNMKVSVANGLGALGRSGFWRKIRLPERDERGDRVSYVLKPGEFVLAMTHERVTVPPDMVAMVEGRSTYARIGVSMHETAPWIQPGWTDSSITLEIKNNGPLNVELTPLIDRPCQLTFILLTHSVPSEILYGSKPTDVYQHQEDPLVHRSPPRVAAAKAAPQRRPDAQRAKSRRTKSAKPVRRH